ncbi:MAG: hypothetical protein RL177_432 [Bacteroidota bacterium]
MESKYIDILHAHDLKVTAVRVHVLQVLMNSASAMSHQALTAALSDENLDKVTLYRTLSVFTEKGILHKIPTEDRNWLYAMSPEVEAGSHAHFVCDVCDKVFCFPVPHVVNPVTLPKPGFQVTSQEILLHGNCPTCHE